MVDVVTGVVGVVFFEELLVEALEELTLALPVLDPDRETCDVVVDPAPLVDVLPAFAIDEVVVGEVGELEELEEVWLRSLGLATLGAGPDVVVASPVSSEIVPELVVEELDEVDDRATFNALSAACVREAARSPVPNRFTPVSCRLAGLYGKG